MKFGSFYTQFNQFSYLRIGGFEKEPLKLPCFPSDYVVFLEVCRQMSIVNVKYLNMGKRGYSFPLSTSIFGCKTNGVAKVVGTFMKKFQFLSLPAKSGLDCEGYVRHHLYRAKGYMHHSELEYFLG